MCAHVRNGIAVSVTAAGASFLLVHVEVPLRFGEGNIEPIYGDDEHGQVYRERERERERSPVTYVARETCRHRRTLEIDG